MTATVWISLGLVGFGISGGLFPEIRLGLVAVGCCRGTLTARLQRGRALLREAIDHLRGAA